ncbi:MAG: tRNA lysidine(34) synthetase TilS [Muribaculaceae bacterium]|nr:tRNA lysidine(34) synthetase TilS [Muribaculaceae bacterium]
MQADSFKKRIASYIAAHDLMDQDGGNVLVTLSGGADSVALLRVLEALGYSCEAAHCNFHLRGDESNRDEAFVTGLCLGLGVKLHVRHFDVEAYRRRHGVSVEMACRDLRYEWFASLSHERGCQCIAVAHHADDNVETFFLNALRGSGIAGLAGMRPRNGNVVRPMLCVSRVDVESFLVELRQPYIIDSTNAQNDYKRNRVRNVVLPCLEREFKGSRNCLYDTVEHVRDYADLMNDLMAHFRGLLCVPCGDGCRISIAGFMAVKVANRALLLHGMIDEYGFSHEQCLTVATLLGKGDVDGQRFYTPDYTLSLNNQCLTIEKTVRHDDESYEVDFNDMSSLPITIEVHSGGNAPFAPSMCNGRDVVAFDRSLLDCRVVLRHWRNGDRMRPFGLHASKLLSDVFADAKLSPEGKKKVWVMEADGVIVWVPGVRAADFGRVSRGATDYVILKASIL